MKMEPTVSSETSTIRTQTPGNCPKRNKLHLEYGESLKTRMVSYSTARKICSTFPADEDYVLSKRGREVAWTSGARRFPYSTFQKSRKHWITALWTSYFPSFLPNSPAHVKNRYSGWINIITSSSAQIKIVANTARQKLCVSSIKWFI